MHTTWIRIFVGLCISLCGVAQAANIYTVTGVSPFGFQNQHVIYESWSQSITYTNVSISAPLKDGSSPAPIAGVEGTVYLVNHIGPGTTAANNVAPPVPLSGLASTFTNIPLWTGLTLPPGSYFIVFASTNNNPMSLSPQGVSNAVTATGLGVAVGTENDLVDLNTVAPFPPASVFNTDITSGNLAVTVTGDTNEVPPAPAVVSAPMLGFAGFAFLGVLLGLLGFAAHRRVW